MSKNNFIQYDNELRNYYSDIFDKGEICSDKEWLEIGIEIIKESAGRLDSDLDNDTTRYDYNQLVAISRQLENIYANYKNHYRKEDLEI